MSEALPPLAKWIISRLDKKHDIEGFVCGEEALDVYLKKYASWNDSANTTRTFVATEPDSTKVLAFYTLSNGSIAFEKVPEKLPNRHPVPICLIGRLAVHSDMQKRGLGEYILYDAMARVEKQADGSGIFAVVVKAKHEKAKAFYTKYDFKPLKEDELELYVTLKHITKLHLNP